MGEAGMAWTPTLWFAPFLVGRETGARGVGTLSAADVKLLEVESAMIMQGRDEHASGHSFSGAVDGRWDVALPQAWGLPQTG